MATARGRGGKRLLGPDGADRLRGGADPALSCASHVPVAHGISGGSGAYGRPALTRKAAKIAKRILVELLLRGLRRRLVRLRSAELRLDDERKNGRPLRRQLRAAITALREKLVVLKTTLKGSFGKQATIQLTGLKGQLSRDATALFREAMNALARLGKPGLKLPPMKIRGVRHDPVAWMEHFRRESEAVGKLVARVQQNKRTTELALVKKRQALDDYDQVFFKLALLLEALFLLSGNDELAEKIRPSRQKKGRVLNELKRPRTRPDADAEPTSADAITRTSH